MLVRSDRSKKKTLQLYKITSYVLLRIVRLELTSLYWHGFLRTVCLPFHHIRSYLLLYIILSIILPCHSLYLYYPL